MDKKVLVIGLDCATSEIVFDHKEEFPVLRELIDNSIYGNLRRSDPPITIPAWMVMCTGKDPGKLGLYGFRHRKDFSYKDIWIATSYSIHEKTVWDIIGERDGQSCLVSVPPSYPPKPVNGNLISCFITPIPQIFVSSWKRSSVPISSMLFFVQMRRTNFWNKYMK